jgi:hypothetical protein
MGKNLPDFQRLAKADFCRRAGPALPRTPTAIDKVVAQISKSAPRQNTLALRRFGNRFDA